MGGEAWTDHSLEKVWIRREGKILVVRQVKGKGRILFRIG